MSYGANIADAFRQARYVAELEEQLLQPEREEEHMVTQAAATGQDILRRSDADPRAVLNVVVGRNR
jgi:hypothetical protein